MPRPTLTLVPRAAVGAARQAHGRRLPGAPRRRGPAAAQRQAVTARGAKQGVGAALQAARAQRAGFATAGRGVGCLREVGPHTSDELGVGPPDEADKEEERGAGVEHVVPHLLSQLRLRVPHHRLHRLLLERRQLLHALAVHRKVLLPPLGTRRAKSARAAPPRPAPPRRRARKCAEKHPPSQVRVRIGQRVRPWSSEGEAVL